MVGPMSAIHARTIRVRTLIALPGEGETFRAQRIEAQGVEITLEPEIGGDIMLQASLVTYSDDVARIADLEAENAALRTEVAVERARHGVLPEVLQKAVDYLERELDRILPEEP
jgi:hypothetical protein